MLCGQTARLRCSKEGSSSGPGELPWTETHVTPDLRHLAVYPSAEEPARPDVKNLSGFFDALQGRSGDVHGAPPKGPYDLVISGGFDGHNYRRQDPGVPRSPDTAPGLLSRSP